jgi:hypothetical protein
MVFNATFNNISIMSWRLAFLVEENGVPRELILILDTTNNQGKSERSEEPLVILSVIFHTT